MNYQITLMFEHCVVSTTIYGSPAGLEEAELVEIALENIDADFGTGPRPYHDVEITSWED